MISSARRPSGEEPSGRPIVAPRCVLNSTAYRIAETGDHAALLARPGIYAELFTLQAEGYLGR